MMYKDIFPSGNGVFKTVFKANYPTEYAAIFGDTAPEKLDLFTALNYGNREMVAAVTTDNAKEMAAAVIALYVQGWQREAAAMLAEYDTANPTEKETVRTESVTSEETANGTEINADVAFNDTDFSDKDKKSKQDGNTRSEEHTINEKVTGIGTGKSFSTEIEKELRLRRDIWRKNVIFALIKEITLDIYL